MAISHTANSAVQLFDRICIIVELGGNNGKHQNSRCGARSVMNESSITRSISKNHYSPAFQNGIGNVPEVFQRLSFLRDNNTVVRHVVRHLFATQFRDQISRNARDLITLPRRKSLV